VKILGINTESLALSIVAVVASVLLAIGVWIGVWPRLVLLAVIGFGLVFAAGDIREVIPPSERVEQRSRRDSSDPDRAPPPRGSARNSTATVANGNHEHTAHRPDNLRQSLAPACLRSGRAGANTRPSVSREVVVGSLPPLLAIVR